MVSNDNNAYLTPGQAARMLMISPVTLRTWARKGLLPFVTTPGGHRRFRAEIVEQFAGREQEPPSHDDCRILIVDADSEISNLLTDTLTGLSCPSVVYSASDEFEAIKKIFMFEPNIILLNLNMEKLDGLEFCRRIKTDPDTGGIRIIVMTCDMGPEKQQRIFDAGAESCIAKPVDAHFLLELLDAG
jgi:excisionase family DNA binding protein